MTSLARRNLLAGATLGAAGVLLSPRVVRALGAPTPAGLWSIDAGPVRVARGPWPGADYLPAGVHFENLLLQMPDGVRLNALLFIPASTRRGVRVGTQMAADPYRNEPNGALARAMAGQAQDGFASLYLDVRGTGGSEGVATDEYALAEYDDLVHVVEWISRQPWSNGAVGMYGTSYSAFNSIWMAAKYKPPALKAIFVRGGTDDRYTDDCHSPGGIQMMVDNSWALGMITDNASPGAPAYDLYSKAALERWNTPPWLDIFLHNQLDGPHYRRGSLAPDQYGLLTTPTFLVGGTMDMYQNFVPRIMRNAPAVTHGVLGPWNHSMTWPGPLLDWRAMQSRWFDHYLNGRDNGVLEEPRVAYYMARWRRQSFRDAGAIPGEWRYADSWPQTVFDPGKKFFLRPSGAVGDLAEVVPDAGALTLRYAPATGGFSESIGPSSYEGYYGVDSREDDVWGLVFDSAPLREPMEILGFVRAHLFAAADVPQANWIVRINDLAPDGTSYIVTYGFLNGAHRHSHTDPTPLPIGEAVELDFSLFCAAYRFDPGHRIRVVVTNAYFPVVWPSPYPMTTTLFTGGARASFIALPLLAPTPSLEGRLPVLASHKPAAPDAMSAYKLDRDMISGLVRATWKMGDDVIGCEIRPDDPAHAALTIDTRDIFRPSDGRPDVESHTLGALTSSVETFDMDLTCTLSQGGKTVRSRRWTTRVKRQFV
jgi:putative CocE/NonD family hydrolase